MGERKLMIVEGYTVPAEIEDAALSWIRGETGVQAFKANDLVRKLIGDGVPAASVQKLYGPSWSPAYRIADRLLQRERKARTIRFKAGHWWPAGKTDPFPAPLATRGR